MSLESIFPKNLLFINKVSEQGFDLDSLIFVCKDLFGIFNDLKMRTHEINDFIVNLKNVSDSKQGKIGIEDNDNVPLKISVMNTLTNKIVYFMLCSNDFNNPKYSCEMCATVLTRTDLKKHVIYHENNQISSHLQGK